MTKVLPALILLATLALIYLAMYAAWRRRRSNGISRKMPHEFTHAEVFESIPDLLYVTTTRQDDVLERFDVQGLLSRGRARIDLSDQGIEISVRGETPVAIPRNLISGFSAQQFTNGKVVERDGLVGVHWRCEDTNVVSVFRGVTQEAQQRLHDLRTSPNPLSPNAIITEIRSAS